MNKKNAPTRKLSLSKQTVRRLGDSEMRRAAGGMPTLTFTMACNTANCMTLGEFCVPTNNCMTLGEYCRTSGCMLSFGC
jgi:hypothetical protein